MSSEYHSQLISNLYNSKNDDEAYEVLRSMDEVPDVSFLYPIYDAYLKYKYTFWSNGFISSLSGIDSSHTLDIIKSIAKDKTTSANDLVACLTYLSKVSDFDGEIVELAENALINYATHSVKIYFINALLSYLKKAEKLPLYEEFLKVIFLDDLHSKEDRRSALRYFLEVNKKKNFNYFTDNFPAIRGKEAELLLTKEVLTWSGPLVDVLLMKIQSEGSAGSKLLIEQKLKKQDEREKAQTAVEADEYTNAKIVSKISASRRKNNELSIALFGHKIFPDDETILSQSETIKDKNALIVSCTSLRDVLQNIENDAKKHEMTLDEALIHVNSISQQDLNKSVNSLHLYLIRKGINIDSEMFGIRPLNKILSLLGAHQESQELIPVLQRYNLIDLYTKENWGILHKEILKRYLNSLLGLEKSLSEHLKEPK